MNPRGRNLGHALLGARARGADELSRGRRVGHIPPIDY
jgi:hypothetical protein